MRRPSKIFTVVLIVVIQAMAGPLMAQERCNDIFDLSWESYFKPSLEMAIEHSHWESFYQLKAHMASPRMTPAIKRLEKHERELEKGTVFGHPHQAALSDVVWFLRFHPEVAIRRAALEILVKNEARYHIWQAIISARLFEIDPVFKAELGQLIEANRKNIESIERLYTLSKDMLDSHPQLNPAQKKILWNLVQEGKSWINKTEIEAIIEQLPAEVKWLNKLRQNSTKSSEGKRIYENALDLVLARRNQLARHLLAQEINQKFREGAIEVLDIQLRSDSLNQLKFKDHHPPFTPSEPFLKIKVNDGFEISLTRAYGGESHWGGSWFFPDRPGYLKTTAEAKDTGALPDANAVTHWRKVTFRGGEEFYLGTINPLFKRDGTPIKDFGVGGMGGDIQFWRDPIMDTPQGPKQKPYFSQDQMGREVETLQDPVLLKLYSEIKSVTKFGFQFNWDHALLQLKNMKEANEVRPDPKRSQELDFLESEAKYYHHKGYVESLNRNLMDMPSNARSMDSLLDVGVKAENNFIDRGMGYFKPPLLASPQARLKWLETFEWATQMREAYEAQVKDYFQNGKIPVKIEFALDSN